MNRLMKAAGHQVISLGEKRMKRFDRLIFVSNSDTCRAPMAKGIMRSKYLLSDLEVDSRGLVVLFPEPVNPKVEAVMESITRA